MTWIICMVALIIPFFYTLDITMYLWLFAIALLGTMLVRSLVHRIATIAMVVSYSLLTIFFNFYLDFQRIFEFIFLINGVTLSWNVMGTLVGASIAIHGCVSGCKAKQYKGGIVIIAFVIALTTIDILFAHYFLGIVNVNELVLIALTQIGIYGCALTITWVLTYGIMRLFVMAGSAIMNMQSFTEEY